MLSRWLWTPFNPRKRRVFPSHCLNGKWVHVIGDAVDRQFVEFAVGVLDSYNEHLGMYGVYVCVFETMLSDSTCVCVFLWGRSRGNLYTKGTLLEVGGCMPSLALPKWEVGARDW